MTFRSSVLVLAALAPIAASAQSNTFELHQNGKPIGKDVFTLSKTKNGYKLVGLENLRIGMKDLDVREEFTYSDTYAFLEGSATDRSINQQSAYLPSSNHKDFAISVTAAGMLSSKIIDLKPNPIVLPSFDPGAAQALLLEATTHPTADNHYSIFIPDNGAIGAPNPNDPNAPPRSPDQTLPPIAQFYDSVWIKGGPMTGTLDGKPINIKTYALAFGKFRWIFFADESNNLMQCNSTLVHGSYIREKFKLDPPPQATAR